MLLTVAVNLLVIVNSQIYMENANSVPRITRFKIKRIVFFIKTIVKE